MASKSTTRQFVLALLLATALPVAAEEAGSWQLRAADWSRPRSGEAVLAMAPVAQAVRAWQATQAGRLLLVHSGGEEGSLWAAELRDWLVALGLPPEAVVAVPGGQPSDRLEIRLEAGR